VVCQFLEQARPHFRTRSLRDSKKELFDCATLRLDQAGGVHVIPLPDVARLVLLVSDNHAQRMPANR
jgi:hypothetical protein